jgi:hypothetical protein
LFFPSPPSLVVSPHQRQGPPPLPSYHAPNRHTKKRRSGLFGDCREPRVEINGSSSSSSAVLDPRPSRNHLIMNNGPIYTERTAFPLLLPLKSFFRLYKN